MRTWPRCASHLVILEETQRRERQCAALAGRPPATPAGDQDRPDRIAFPASVRAFLRDDRGSSKEENNVAHDARCIEHFTRARETMAVSATMRVDRRFVGWMSIRAGMARHRCRNWSGRLL